MSREGSDTSYRPKRRLHLSETEHRRSRCPRSSRVDYKEVEVLSGSDSEETIVDSELGRQSVKLEREGSVPGFEGETEENLWTPDTLKSRANQVSEQFSRLDRVNSEETMAREGEKGELVRIMEILMQMRAEDMKAAQIKEERREREDREREDRRIERETEREEIRIRELRDQKEADLRREERLLTTLKDAQPAVPQHVNGSEPKVA